MLRCILFRRRIVSSVGYIPTCRTKFSLNGQSHFGTRQALWAGLDERSTLLPGRIHGNSCSSTQQLPEDQIYVNSELSETSTPKKLKSVKHRRKKSEGEQKINEIEISEEKCRKKARKRSKKAKIPEENDSDVLKSPRNQRHTNNIAKTLPSLSFPFDGSSYTETDDEFGIYHHGLADLSCSNNSSVIHMMENCSSEDRFYRVSSSAESVIFPSVTTVLGNTVSKSQYYRLRNWKRNMIKEYGEAEFESIQQQTRDIGTHFHQFGTYLPTFRLDALAILRKLEQKLSELMLPNAISIKPQHIPTNEKHPVLSSHKSSVVSVDRDIDKERIVARASSVEGFEQRSGDKINIHDEKWTILSPHKLSSRLDINKETRTAVTEPSGRRGVKVYESVEKNDCQYVKSVEHVLEHITSVLALESVVTHHELGYTGTFDCVAKYRGVVCLIDWKSSSRPRPTLTDCFEYPLQAVAYAGAVNHDDHYPFKILNALIVVAYPDGTPAHAHFLTHEQCQYYWSKWLQRLQDYQTQFASDHSNVY